MAASDRLPPGHDRFVLDVRSRRHRRREALERGPDVGQRESGVGCAAGDGGPQPLELLAVPPERHGPHAHGSPPATAGGPPLWPSFWPSFCQGRNLPRRRRLAMTREWTGAKPPLARRRPTSTASAQVVTLAPAKAVVMAAIDS
jgi:hypothetical protein